MSFLNGFIHTKRHHKDKLLIRVHSHMRFIGHELFIQNNVVNSCIRTYYLVNFAWTEKLNNGLQTLFFWNCADLKVHAVVHT